MAGYRLDYSELLTRKIIVGAGKSRKVSRKKVYIDIGWELL